MMLWFLYLKITYIKQKAVIIISPPLGTDLLNAAWTFYLESLTTVKTS